MSETIYMPLDDEGTVVWRPVPAYRSDGGRYIVLRPKDYDASVETWRFPPGSVVECEPKSTGEGQVLAAVRQVPAEMALGKRVG